MSKHESGFSINELVIIFCAATWVGAIIEIANRDPRYIDWSFLLMAAMTFCLVPMEYHTTKYWDIISQRYMPSQQSIRADRTNALLVVIETFRILFLSLCFVYMRIPLKITGNAKIGNKEYCYYIAFIGVYLVFTFFWNLVALGEDRAVDGSGTRKALYGKYGLFFKNYCESNEYKQNKDYAFFEQIVNGKPVLAIRFSSIVSFFKNANLFIYGAFFPILGLFALAYVGACYENNLILKLTGYSLLIDLPHYTTLITFWFFGAQLVFKIFQNLILTVMIDGRTGGGRAVA
ncbi:hypothetical protein [Asticcacaulis solisilvae]|uniref:hypothetical protein n=1 Tax=Asticcacaulis solisilvae TaxID=1217274 RepID=UPI003FD72A21